LLPDGHSPSGRGRPEQNENIPQVRDNDVGQQLALTHGLRSCPREDQTGIYYVAGPDLAQPEASPQLEGFQARGIEVLLLPDPVDSFSVTVADYECEPFRLVTLGAAEFALIQLIDTTAWPETAALDDVKSFVDTVKTVLSDQFSDGCLRATDRG
jgi:molecular chaperone HtpG